MKVGIFLSQARSIQLILNHMIRSLKEVLPVKVDISGPTITPEPFIQKELTVLIGMVGDTKGRLIIDTTLDAMRTIGYEMFKMEVSDEMIESLSGEVGNMLAGNLSVGLERDAFLIDITTPTVMTGTSKIHGFGKAITLPVTLNDQHTMKVLVILDEDA